MKINDQNSFSQEGAEKKNIFLVPENYFESLEQKIKNRILELNPSLKTDVFEIPEAYFEQSQNSINHKLANENVLDNPVLKDSVFKTPEGYFLEMENKIDTERLFEKQANEKIIILNERYFETLNDRIHYKIGEKDNVVKFDFTSNAIVRYAVAASVSMVLVASSLFFMLNNREENLVSQKNKDEKIANVLLATLDKNEVSLYLEKQEIETHELIEFASENKKEKIKNEFEREIISARISDKEKQAIELELNDLDEFEMPTDI